MRIGRSITRIIIIASAQLACAAVTGYFGYNALWGERGFYALENTEARLTVAEAKLGRMTGERLKLEHRIDLLGTDHPDPDLVEELARTQLMDGAPNQVAVPRASQSK
jgi:cell division protein FtsB